MSDSDNDKTQLRPISSAWIVRAVDGKPGETVVPPQGAITFGRELACDVVIDDRFVSRRHAEMFTRDGRLYVRDLNSTHGTSVNGKRITESEVGDGDEIRLEKFAFVVRRLGAPDAPVAATQTVAAADQRTVIARVREEPAPPAPAAQAERPKEAAPAKESAPLKESAPAKEAAPAKEPAAPAPPPAAASAASAAAPSEPRAQGRGNWWDPQDQGPMGTRLVKVSDMIDAPPAEALPEIETSGPVLVGITPPFRNRRFDLQAGKLMVGKAASADIRIEDEFVSDVHAQLVGDGERWKVVNLLSSNGTFVNGTKITQAAYLRPGDVVRFGRVELRFADGGYRRRTAAATAAASGGARRRPYFVIGFVITFAAIVAAVLLLK